MAPRPLPEMAAATDGSGIPASPAWRVHKFGGTSVADAACYQKVRAIVEGELRAGAGRLAVVVSAMGGKPKTTDLLLQSVRHAAQGEIAARDAVLEAVSAKHKAAMQAMLSESEAERLLKVFEQDFADIRGILQTVALVRSEDERFLELVSGYGELWSAQMLSSLLNAHGNAFHYVDARRVIHVDEDGGDILWDLSRSKLEEVLAEVPADTSLCITGYVASTEKGSVTTLKRDGSDYSASIMGRLLEAAGITIWTDVPGVMSADPRRVPDAKVVPEVSFNEAMELAYFGAKVIHPKTMTPAVAANVPIYIRDTFQPELVGTRIFTSSSLHTGRQGIICGLSTIDGVALVNVEGSGMMGVPGVASRLFGALHSRGISVLLIAQASSEHSITFATRASEADTAAAAVRDAFQLELRRGFISAVEVQQPCTVVAAVGDGMARHSGVAGRFFQALGHAKINVVAISQGCSERNISAVVMSEDSERALRAVHGALLPTDHSPKHHRLTVPAFDAPRAELEAHIADLEAMLEAARHRLANM